EKRRSWTASRVLRDIARLFLGDLRAETARHERRLSGESDVHSVAGHGCLRRGTCQADGCVGSTRSDRKREVEDPQASEARAAHLRSMVGTYSVGRVRWAGGC